MKECVCVGTAIVIMTILNMLFTETIKDVFLLDILVGMEFVLGGIFCEVMK